MIDAPHEDAQDGVARSKHFHLLLNKVLLFRFGLGRQDHHGTGNSPRVTEGSHDHRLALSRPCKRERESAGAGGDTSS